MKSKKVAQVDSLGRIKIWNSIDEICTSMNCSYNNINEAINNNMITFGCIWKYVTKAEANKMLKLASGTINKLSHGWKSINKSDKHGGSRRPQAVIQIAKNGMYMGMYKSYYNAEKVTGVENHEIWLAANGKKKYAGGYKWVKVAF